jgi:preprotein translocase YajC subunit
MLFQLLTSSSSSTPATKQGVDWGAIIMVLVLVALLVVFMVYNKRAQTKAKKEQDALLEYIKPGNKVKTIGGICGVIVEVCDDGTFVLETGTEASGKSFIKFDKQAIYQTDAQKVETPAQTVETPAEAPVEENTEASVDEKVEATWEK